MLARMKRVNPPTEWIVKVRTGRIIYCRRSRMPPSPTVSMPPAGSQPSTTAKQRMSRRASQKGGSEMPAKQNMFTA